MIVRPRPPLWKLFFILKGSIILRILPQIFAVFLLSLLVVWAHRAFPGWVPAVNNGTALALLGIALSIFLGFRNNACYDRWWEARKIWGKLVYTTRSLARQTLLLENTPELEGSRKSCSIMRSHFRRPWSAIFGQRKPAAQANTTNGCQQKSGRHWRKAATSPILSCASSVPCLRICG